MATRRNHGFSKNTQESSGKPIDKRGELENRAIKKCQKTEPAHDISVPGF